MEKGDAVLKSAERIFKCPVLKPIILSMLSWLKPNTSPSSIINAATANIMMRNVRIVRILALVIFAQARLNMKVILLRIHYSPVMHTNNSPGVMHNMLIMS